MSLLRCLFCAVLIASLRPAPMQAAWTDRRLGNPVTDFFPDRVIGATAQTGPMVQDARGRLLVGSDSLLVYDGVNWTSRPLPDSHDLFALCSGPDGKLWAGATNQVGYYTENNSGDFVFTSLVARLPPADRHFEETWACGMVGSRIFFVCKSKVLGWDGAGFQVWDFPTQTRLFPVFLGGEIWFTHLETGLYRLTAGGPHREYSPAELPPRPAFGLERDARGLRVLSRDGLYYAGRPGQPLCSNEVIDFLRTRPISSTLRLPDGNLAIGTYGGLGIMSPDGRLLKALNQADGLASDSINALFLDRERRLWISNSAGGMARLDATGAVSIFNRWNQADHTAVFRLTQIEGTIFAATDSGLYRLETTAARGTRFVPFIKGIPAHVEELASGPAGLLLGHFGGLDCFDGRQSRPALTGEAQNFWRILPSKRQPEGLFCLIDRQIAKIHPGADGRWQRQVLGELPDLADNCYLDSQDALWFNSATTGVWRFDTASRQLTQIHDGTKPGCPTEASQVTGFGSRIYLFTTHEGYVAEAGSKKLQLLAGFPEVTTLQCTPSTDGRRLFVVFERKRPAGGSVYGLGSLALDAQGSPGAWTEWQTPKLAAAGVPSTLLATREEGTDTLWLGGSENVVRIKPDELPPVRPPAAPWLQILASSGLATTAGPVPAYAFARHHLTIQAGSADIDDRPDLDFETRLGDGRGEWSPPSPQSTFEFTNLSDGAYRFEVRTVNGAGLVSPPAAFRFLILPPWYRTPGAYLGFFATAVLAVFGYVRFHERRIRRRNQQLENLVEKRTAELVRANAAKDEFLAGISHEIRNPMNGVIGIASIIDSSKFDPITRRHMTQLRHCATHLSGLLEDILDHARLQAGGTELNPQPFDLREMTQAIAALTSAESEARGIPVEIAVSPTVPRGLIGDVARLRQIVLNLTVNALKYSGRGTVCLTMWGRQDSPERFALTIAVSDDGLGISAAEQARLFTRFERGAAAQAQRVAGTGLGLALCKTLGEKMGGRLWVESEPGHGATFYFALPLPVVRATAIRPAQAGPAATPTIPRHALVVDDEEYNRLTLAGFLREEGFAVTLAANGQEALAAARDQQGLDAIFLDMNLPDRSGPEIARILRTLPQLDAGLPIIATTAYTAPEKRAECFEAGMSAFMSKPVSPEKIQAALTAATAARRPAAPFHPPGQNGTGDSLGRLRLLAGRKGVSLDAEIAAYLAELGSEERLLAEAMQRREPVTAGATAHRLVGRLAFIRAAVEERLAGEIEANSLNGFWDQAESSAALLRTLLPGLRDRITSACEAAQTGSGR